MYGCVATLDFFGQRAVVPSFEEFLNSIKAAGKKPLILNGKLAPGLADSLRALQKNEYHSFFGKTKKYGMDKKDFYKDFKKLAEKPYVYTNMLVKEMNVTGLSPNGRQHSNLFIVCPTKYKEATDQYVTSAKKVTRKVKFSHLHDDNLSIDSDNSTHTRKRGKQEDMNMDYMSRYYKFVLEL